MKQKIFLEFPVSSLFWRLTEIVVGSFYTYVMATLPTFQLYLKMDERPIKTPSMKRFSLVLEAPGRQQLEIKGFLFDERTSDILAPLTFISNNRPYEIVSVSAPLKGALLRSFHQQQRLDQLPIDMTEIVPTGKDAPDGI